MCTCIVCILCVCTCTCCTVVNAHTYMRKYIFTYVLLYVHVCTCYTVVHADTYMRTYMYICVNIYTVYIRLYYKRIYTVYSLYLRWGIRKWALRIWELNPQSALFADLRIADSPTKCHKRMRICGFADCGFPNVGLYVYTVHVHNTYIHVHVYVLLQLAWVKLSFCVVCGPGWIFDIDNVELDCWFFVIILWWFWNCFEKWENEKETEK